MSWMIYAVWGAGIALHGAATLRMALNGLARRYPLVWGYLALCFVASTVLAAVRSQPKVYLTLHSALLPLRLLVQCGAIATIFWALTATYRDLRQAGSMILGVLSAIGVLTAWASTYRVFPTPSAYFSTWLWSGGLFIQRFGSVAMIVVLAGTRFILPTARRMPIPPFALRSSEILAADAMLGLYAAWFAGKYGFTLTTLTPLVSWTCGLVSGALWLIAAKPPKEPYFLVVPDVLDEDSSQSVQKLPVSISEFDKMLRSFEVVEPAPQERLQGE